MTSGGEPKEVEEAKKAIFYAAVGFLVILFAAGLVSLITNILGYSGGGSTAPALDSSLRGNEDRFRLNAPPSRIPIFTPTPAPSTKLGGGID